MNNCDYSEAQNEAASLQQKKPGLMLFSLLQAQIASKQGQHDRALKSYAEIYESDKTSLAAITYYAEELAQRQKFAEARKVLRRAVRKHTDSVEFFEMLSRVESRLGSQMESHRALSEAYALLGNYQSAVQQLNIARTLASKDDFYVQASITARIKELEGLLALEKQK